MASETFMARFPWCVGASVARMERRREAPPVIPGRRRERVYARLRRAMAASPESIITAIADCASAERRGLAWGYGFRPSLRSAGMTKPKNLNAGPENRAGVAAMRPTSREALSAELV